MMQMICVTEQRLLLTDNRTYLSLRPTQENGSLIQCRLRKYCTTYLVEHCLCTVWHNVMQLRYWYVLH